MVSWLPHLVIPGLLALAFFPASRKRLLALAPLVWLPDVDYIVPSAHRAATHSVLIPLALLVAVTVLWRRQDPTARWAEFVTRPGHPVNLTIAAYYFASHILLDVFQGGVVLLWPLLDTNVYLGFQLILDTGTNTFTPSGEAGTEQGAPALSPRYPWISTRDTAIAAFLVATLAFWGLLKGWQRATGRAPPRPVVVERPSMLLGTIQKR
ncbi:MAG: metal-dependent hydrolase [Thermoplasmatota archaeon]